MRTISRLVTSALNAVGKIVIVRNMASGRAIKQQYYDYFLVLDFEATCENNKKMIPQEIIEFPVLKVNGKTFEVESEFHQYVLPRVHGELTQFCTELTGIIQDMVDGQPYLEDTLKSFHAWMKDEGLLQNDIQSVFVTCGDWDLNVMLPGQSRYFNSPYAPYLKKWINIKKPYADIMTVYPRGMLGMLSKLGLQHTGRHHSGIDDCRNIAKILKALAERGALFKQTGSIS